MLAADLEGQNRDRKDVEPAKREDQEHLRREIREFAAREIAPNVLAWDEASEFPLDARTGRMGAYRHWLLHLQQRTVCYG
jgi:alkylation response protein AidB-like acyl-CoA dehydrogenase